MKVLAPSVPVDVRGWLNNFPPSVIIYIKNIMYFIYMYIFSYFIVLYRQGNVYKK